MLVKELIAKLSEHHPNRRVVVDTLEGLLDVDTSVVEGGTNSDGVVYEPVIILSLISDEETSYDTWFRQKVQEALDDTRPTIPHAEVMAGIDALLEEAPYEPTTITSIVTTKSGEEVIFQIIANEDGGLDVSVEGSIKSAYIQED